MERGEGLAMVPPPDAAAVREFQRVVSEYDVRVYRFILKRVGHPDDAQDLTQQTFLEAYRQLGRFRGESTMWTWLCAIANNVARNHRARAPQHRYSFVSDEVLEFHPADAADPEEANARRQQVRRLRAALDELSDDARAVFVLVALEGMSYEDAARILDVPVGTVRSRLSRARNALRERLDGTFPHIG
ncbi:MAG TPA: RNA polymerase sigma factor [Azospirillum sp.]|nr:RNA polymerase sigma factor [Azospirillum sp.]